MYDLKTAAPVQEEVCALLRDTLNLTGRAAELTAETGLFGSLPEFDSMAVVAVLTALEERFGIVIEDDEIDAAIFRTVGSLTDFVRRKRAD